MHQTGPTAWRCTVCGTTVPIARPLVFRCPRWTPADPFHVLQLVADGQVRQVSASANPFVAYQPLFAWDAFAAARGMSVDQRHALVSATDAAVAEVARTGFHVTPFGRADRLSDELGFSARGGVWIKNETQQVAGSHKARHLMSALLALLVAEQTGATPWRGLVDDRPALAIASCGNAALAAATLAAAVGWRLAVFVPPAASEVVLARLHTLGAQINVCPRRDEDPPGDPCVLRYREAVQAGALAFSVQGPENAWCLDGGRTLGWEMAEVALDRVFIQVGGGALASCAIRGLHDAGSRAQLHPVQTEGCAPFERAWRRAQYGPGGPATAAQHWGEYMRPWPTAPQSRADGILDDETYDWLGIVDGMLTNGGAPVVATEADVLRAQDLCHRFTDIDASATGTAGLAGVLAARGQIGADERVAVVFSGIRR